MFVGPRALRTAGLNFSTFGASAREVWRPLCCGGRIAKYVLWKSEEKWRAKGWGLSFGGQHDNACLLRGMMSADNKWLFWDNKERLICIVNDLTELLDLDMEPKRESLWWTSTHNDEEKITSSSGKQRQSLG